jgi:hypothetical protein
MNIPLNIIYFFETSLKFTAPNKQQRSSDISLSKALQRLTGALILCLACQVQAVNLTIDGGTKYQTMDGFGVNANSLSWNDGELKPAINMLADEMGSNLWRVVFDMENWEASNDNSDPSIFNWTYYNALYANPKFQNLWGTLGYLNQKGLSQGVALSFMGGVPGWMSGTGSACSGGNGNNICVAAEDEWVEMIASLTYYARITLHLPISLIDPINEPDWNGIEGPQVDATQYTRLLHKLSDRLDYLGLNDINFLGPNTASVDTGVITYMSAMMSDPVVMSKVYHFGFHNYAGYSDSAANAIKNSGYPNRNFYMTEITRPEDILTIINGGPSAIHIWDGYDSVYEHALLMGYGSTPPNDAGNGPAPLAYDMGTGQYSKRKEFYEHEQLFKFVPTGSVRVAVSQSNISAFVHAASGRLSIVGNNATSGAIAYTASLVNLPRVNALQFYWTSKTDPSINFLRASDITVTNGTSFSFSAPANSIFTLTGLAIGGDLTPPTVSITSPTEGTTLSGTTTITASAADMVGVAAVRFLLDGGNLSSDIFAPSPSTSNLYSFSWDTTTVTAGNHQLSAVARDIAGNVATSLPIAISLYNTDPTPPSVAITSPANGATVTGTINLTATASDNLGVAGVQFVLDGVPFQNEITTAPYTVVLNTTTIANGGHSVVARARDTSGNTTTSSSVPFMVSNAPGSVSPIGLVQKISNNTASAQNLAATFSSPVTGGNLIVVSVSGWPNLPASTAVTDSRGNTYNIAGNILISQGAYSAIYYTNNVIAGSTTVTVRTVSNGGQISMVAAEFSGVEKVSALDQVAGALGSGVTPSSGSLVPAQVGDLLIGSGTHNGNTTTSAGPGFTMIAVATEDSVSHQPLAMEFQVLPGTQPVAASFMLANGYPWTQNGALFRAATMPGGTDVTPPSVSITSPQNGATVSGAVAVSAAATDNVGVSRVDFYVNDLLQSSSAAPPYNWTWNTLSLANGSYTLNAKVYDLAGNSGQASIAITVFNDTTPPVVSLAAPSNGATVSGTIQLSATVIDNVGVSKVEFYVNNNLLGSDSASPYGFDWNSASVADGAYTVTAKAYDNAGNMGVSNVAAITVSNGTAAIALVQQASNITSNARSLAATLTANVTAGDLIVVSVSGWPNPPASTALTDSLGNTYSRAGSVLLFQGAYSAIYYAKNAKAGRTTVTVRTAASKGQISMVAAEFSGVDTNSPLDKVAGTVGSGTSPSSGTMVPTQANELAIGAGTHNGNTVTSTGSGFAMIAIPTEDSNSHQPLAMEYQILTASQPISPGFTLASPYPWTQNGALFKHR